MTDVYVGFQCSNNRTNPRIEIAAKPDAAVSQRKPKSKPAVYAEYEARPEMFRECCDFLRYSFYFRFGFRCSRRSSLWPLNYSFLQTAIHSADFWKVSTPETTIRDEIGGMTSSTELIQL